MFDAGAVPDSHFKADGAPITEGIMSASKPLKPQLKAAGYSPADVDYLAMSHYHSDHTANANDFASRNVDRAEGRARLHARRQTARHHPARSLQRAAQGQDASANNEDLDVFGDGTVVVMSTPGHTPGHQVLFVKLAKRAPVVLAGDLYHYPEERTTGRIPTFEFNADQSRASRAEGGSVPQAEQGGALDRARHRDARQAAEGAGVYRIANSNVSRAS